MRGQVCAVSVAYNDPKGLNTLLSSLSNQGPVLSGLVIIDNSDDGYAEENKLAFDEWSVGYTFAHYVKTDGNVGSAGGFRQGMRIAHEKAYAWMWLLDQDGSVSASCLSELLKHADKGALLCPKIVDIDQPAVVLSYLRNTRNLFGRFCPVPSGTASREIDAFATHGALISKNVLDVIGYYDATYFFAGWEDYYYALKARASGFVIFFVASAEVRHPDLRRKKATRDRRIAQDPALGQTTEQNAVPLGRPYVISAADQSAFYMAHVFNRLPARFGRIIYHKAFERPCERDRSFEIFSELYMYCEILTTGQFAFAVAWNLLTGSFDKFVRGRYIRLRKTLKLYLTCLVANVRNEWQYDSMEELCRHVMG